MMNRSRPERLLVLALVAAGCGGGDDVTAGEPAKPAKVLVASSPAGPDATCAAGGTRLDFGTDANGNGTLDADEITASQSVCGSASALTTATPSGPSDKCKGGGTTIKSGVDKNGNGALDADEVTQTTEICGGGSSVELSKTSPLPEGDATCPFGGTKTEAGFDDGANGSAAANGVLEPGEITSTSVTCVSDNEYKGTFVPPAGPAGTSKIMTSGGVGLTGPGGAGGLFTLKLDEGTLGGNIAVFKTGKVDADFTSAPPKPSFGATKLEVAADLSIQARASADAAADGEYYVLVDTLYFRQSAANKQVPVTGLHVAPGATLTLPGGTVKVAGDVHLEGTLTTGLVGGNRPPVTLFPSGRYVASDKSKIALAGAPVAGGAGGSGGGFVVLASAIYSAGAIDVSGANGDPGGAYAGGSAGSVTLGAILDPTYGPVESTGDIKATGGSGKGAGGSGGTIALGASSRGVRAKGTFDQSGGAGTTGGAGGNFTVLSRFGGGVRFGGTLTRKGGDVDEAACGGVCQGGSVGGATVTADGGGIDWSANVVAGGGKSKGTIGGAGGAFTFSSAKATDPFLSVERPAGTVRVSGNFDLKGGAGAAGGVGGAFTIVPPTPTLPSGQEILLYGYDGIDTSGGNGAIGGNAGTIVLQNGASPGSRATGSVLSHANLVGRGGSGSAGGGGSGALIGLATGIGTPEAKRSQAVVISGTIDNSGGAGTLLGGNVGVVLAMARERIVVSGAVTSTGGAASGASGVAGGGGAVQLTSVEGVTITAPISLAGGSGTGPSSKGGACTSLSITGESVRATAPLTCAGGSGAGGAGGDGGAISVTSSVAASSVAALAAPGGAGTPSGAAGAITVDGNAY